ncbi:MAG: dTDP-4-amino-4,6-dideoxygalactose transaminase [Flavobacteriales bacterium]|nr:dTDP-4-amino-4,6-dideoxygalactose transaminase [Flavobacteriales bacterium]
MTRPIIPFNQPHLSGKEQEYILAAVAENKLSGNGRFTKQCQQLLQERYGFHRVLLTTSCTDALEMSALLLNIAPGDEVIMPSYTFVSTANAFVLRGAHIRFADSRTDHPGMDEASVEALITPRTKAIVVVHYAGVACDMDIIMDIVARHGLKVVEDAAQAIDSFYKGQALGGIGHLGAFSFHETKNIQCGEGGALVVNDRELAKRAEIIWEKGTNRAAFWRGEVDKYNWVDIGSSFLPSEINAAYLFAQLEQLENIQNQRRALWQWYADGLRDSFRDGHLSAPFIPDFATNNAHMFYVVCRSLDQRDGLLAHLKAAGIYAVFHYQSLHASPYYTKQHDGRNLPQADRYSNCLLRLPLYVGLGKEEVERICQTIRNHFEQ